MEEKVKQRIALGAYFFISGFGFSSWTSRIPTIKDALELNDGQLGSILLAMPISSLLALPLSGWLVSKTDSRWPMIIGALFYCVVLSLIGQVASILTLVITISCYSMSVRIINIAMNTQAIMVQKLYVKKINGAFHGMWSLGGIFGVGFTSLNIALNIGIGPHLMMVSILIFIIAISTFGHLIKRDRASSGNKLYFGKPDPQILILGVMILLAAFCEGGMFEWSGIYFKEVVQVEIFTSGYLVFMTCMAISRFLSDRIINQIGMKKMFILSASLVTVGIALAITFPSFHSAMIGFSLVGFGTAAVIPMTFVLAGNSTKYSPGIAISIIVTYATVGILAGPPIMGYLSYAFGLRISFLFIGVMGLLIIPASRYYYRLIQVNNLTSE